MPFYTDIYVTSDGESSCPITHPHIVIDRIWHGMRNGCNCLGVYDHDITTDNQMVENYNCDHN